MAISIHHVTHLSHLSIDKISFWWISPTGLLNRHHSVHTYFICFWKRTQCLPFLLRSPALILCFVRWGGVSFISCLRFQHVIIWDLGRPLWQSIENACSLADNLKIGLLYKTMIKLTGYVCVNNHLATFAHVACLLLDSFNCLLLPYRSNWMIHTSQKYFFIENNVLAGCQTFVKFCTWSFWRR